MKKSAIINALSKKIDSLFSQAENNTDNEALTALKEEIDSLLEEAEQERASLLWAKYFYKAIVDNLPNAIFVKDKEARYVFCNKKYTEIFDVPLEDFIGRTVYDLDYLPERDRREYQRQDIEMLEKSSVIHYEQDFLFSDNEVHTTLYWSKGFVVPETEERGLVGEIVDLTNEKVLEKRLSETVDKLQDATSAYRTDFATGIGNRYALHHHWPDLVASKEEEQAPLSLFIADLDSFKSVNDTYGHQVGDAVLQEFSRVFTTACREDDLCVRYGGEEFLAVLTDIDLEIAKKIAQRICDNFRALPVLPDGKSLTVSIGLTQYIHGEDLNECIARADEALYYMKNNGKNGVAVK